MIETGSDAVEALQEAIEMVKSGRKPKSRVLDPEENVYVPYTRKNIDGTTSSGEAVVKRKDSLNTSRELNKND